MENAAKSVIKVWSIIFASLCYCYFIVSKIPKGKFRLISLLPIFYLYTILPLHLSSVFTSGVTAFFITWLANFKLLLFAFNIGPLTTPSNNSAFSETPGGSDVRNLGDNRETIKSFPRFLFIAAFPIKIKDPSTQNIIPKKVVPLNFWSETLISSILISICDRYKGQLHPVTICVIYCFLLYLMVDIVIGLSNLLVGPIMGVELVPPSDEPYISTSLQEFWGRRWNLMVTDILRHTVYKPIRVVLSKHINPELAIATGIIATFLVSGLMHELIFYYMTRVSPSWEVTWFFVLHGFCVTVEVALKKVLGHKLKLHWAITGPLTVGFAVGTGYLWFFPPLMNNQADVKTIEELMASYEFIKGVVTKPT